MATFWQYYRSSSQSAVGSTSKKDTSYPNYICPLSVSQFVVIVTRDIIDLTIDHPTYPITITTIILFNYVTFTFEIISLR